MSELFRRIKHLEKSLNLDLSRQFGLFESLGLDREKDLLVRILPGLIFIREDAERTYLRVINTPEAAKLPHVERAAHDLSEDIRKGDLFVRITISRKVSARRRRLEDGSEVSLAEEFRVSSARIVPASIEAYAPLVEADARGKDSPMLGVALPEQVVVTQFRDRQLVGWALPADITSAVAHGYYADVPPNELIASEAVLYPVSKPTVVNGTRKDVTFLRTVLANGKEVVMPEGSFPAGTMGLVSFQGYERLERYEVVPERVSRQAELPRATQTIDPRVIVVGNVPYDIYDVLRRHGVSENTSAQEAERLQGRTLPTLEPEATERRAKAANQRVSRTYLDNEYAKAKLSFEKAIRIARKREPAKREVGEDALAKAIDALPDPGKAGTGN